MESGMASETNLIEIIQISKPRPKPIDLINSNGKTLGGVTGKTLGGVTGKTLNGVKPTTDKEKVTQLLSSLENISLQMRDTEGQGFLFNAFANIRLYLQQ